MRRHSGWPWVWLHSTGRGSTPSESLCRAIRHLTGRSVAWTAAGMDCPWRTSSEPRSLPQRTSSTVRGRRRVTSTLRHFVICPSTKTALVTDFAMIQPGSIANSTASPNRVPLLSRDTSQRVRGVKCVCKQSSPVAVPGCINCSSSSWPLMHRWLTQTLGSIGLGRFDPGPAPARRATCPSVRSLGRSPKCVQVS